MGVIIRQTIKSTVATYLGLLIGYVTILWVMPYCLAKEEVGLLRVIQNMGGLFAAFTHIGMTNIVSKYYNYFKQSEHQGSFTFVLLLAPLFGFAIFSGLYVLLEDQFANYFSSKSELLVDFYWYLLPLTLVVSFFNVLVSYSRALLRSSFPSFLKEILYRVVVVSLVVSYFLGLISLVFVIQGLIIAYLILTIILAIYIKRIDSFPIELSFNVFKNPLSREISKFAMYSMLHGASGILIINIDSIMLSGLKGLDSFGIYSIAFTISMVIEIPRRSISFTAFPAVSEAWKNHDRDQVQKFHTKSSINQSLAGVLIFLLIWTNMDYFFDIMPNGDAYSVGKYVVLIIGSAKLIELFAGLSGELITASKYFFYNLVFSMLLVGVAVFTNWYFIPIYGINGAAIASGISIVAFTLAKTVFIGLKFKMHPFSTKLLWTIVLGGIIFWAANFLPILENPWLGIVLNVFCITSLYVVVSYLLKLSDEAMNIVKKYVPFL